MKDYIDKIFEAFSGMEGNNMKILKNRTAEYLFMVDPNATNINVDKADVFHTKIAEALFICKRARPYLQLTVTFL